jgi:flagellar biogenesis protein FliO
MSFKQMMPVLILIVFVILAASFLPQIMGSIEKGQSTNISQEYKDQLNSTKDVSLITVGFTKFLSPILGVLALIIAVMWIVKRR